jgi:hypothetical protein
MTMFMSWGVLRRWGRARTLRLGHGLDEQDVGAGLGKGLGALHGGVEAVHGGGVGAGHDEQFLVAAGVARGLDLADHFAGLHHVLAGEVAAALGADLVFELDAVGAGALQGAHGVVGVERVAKAGVGIHQQGQLQASRMRAVWSAMSVRPMKPWSGMPNHILVTPAPVT